MSKRPRAAQVRRSRIRAFIAAHRGPSIEIGCGDGYLLTVASVGLDVNPARLALAQQAVPAARLVTGDALTLPFQDGAARTMVCSEVIEHLTDPLRALREICRVLAPGGWLMLTTPNLHSPRRRLALMLCGRTGRRDHLWTFTRESLGELVRRAGLLPVLWEATTIELLWHNWLLGGCLIDRLEVGKEALARLVPRLADGIILLARKEHHGQETPLHRAE